MDASFEYIINKCFRQLLFIRIYFSVCNAFGRYCEDVSFIALLVNPIAVLFFCMIVCAE